MYHAHDVEILADRFEQEEAYALECNDKQALENAVSDAVLSDLKQRVNALLERQASNSRRSKP